jgi:hypothetical protein
VLRLVGGRDLRARVEPREVALWSLDGELAGYLERRLRARWPQARVVRVVGAAPAAPGAIDLWICGAEPPNGLDARVLWLGEVEPRARVTRVARRLWKVAMPLTGRQLEDVLDAIWPQGPAGGSSVG